MRLNNLEFLEVLKQDNQVCGGDSNSDVDVDVDGMIDGEVELIGLESADLFEHEDVTVIVNQGWIETGAVLPPPGSDPSALDITMVGWDGGEFSGSLNFAVG